MSATPPRGPRGPGSYTTEIPSTNTAPAPAHLVFPPCTTAEHVISLVQRLQATGHFTQEIEAWKATSLPRFSDLTKPEARMEAAIRLCYLNSMTKSAYEVLCIPILKNLLPPQIPVEPFLDKFEDLYSQEETNRQMLSEVLSWIKEQEPRLMTLATQARQEILREFQGVKQRAEALHAQRKVCLTTFRAEVSAVTERVRQLQAELQLLTDQASDSYAHLQTQQKDLQAISGQWRKV